MINSARFVWIRASSKTETFRGARKLPKQTQAIKVNFSFKIPQPAPIRNEVEKLSDLDWGDKGTEGKGLVNFVQFPPTSTRIQFFSVKSINNTLQMAIGQHVSKKMGRLIYRLIRFYRQVYELQYGGVCWVSCPSIFFYDWVMMWCPSLVER